MTAFAEEVYMEQFHKIIEIFQPTMDDFLYIYDFVHDEYCISSSAMNRFKLPDKSFTDTAKVFREFVHPEDFAVLMQELKEAQEGRCDFHNLEYRWIDRDDNAVWINCRGQVIRNKENVPCFLIGCINEIGKKQKADNVSGLLRETVLRKELEALENGELSGFVMRFGIDQFKEINENKGMEYGDMILRRTAECIREVCLTEQKLYRVMSDEFMIVDFTGRSAEEAKKLYKKIRPRIDRLIEESGYEVFFTVSAGIIGLEQIEDKSYANLMKLSEFALNEAKIRGRNQCYLYTKDDYLAFLRKHRLIQAMRLAINNDYQGFEAYYQPIVDIHEKRLYGAETLLRFRTEETGPVSPVEFIPMLEESGLIIPVGKWVLEQAMAACSEIQKTIPDFRMSVNLSYIQVSKSNVLSDLKKGIEKYHLKPGSIIVELTESGLFETSTVFQRFCEELKSNSISLALDDFGTGYSNFQYLYHLGPDTIKIDRSFTWKALRDEHDYNILKHMIDMSHGIDMKLCIEGIETEEELAKVSRMQPDFIQGYYFGKPCSFGQFREQHLK